MTTEYTPGQKISAAKEIGKIKIISRLDSIEVIE